MKRNVRLLFKSVSILYFLFLLIMALSACTATRHTVQKIFVPLLNTSVDDLVEKLLKTKNFAIAKEGLPGALLVITGLTELAPKDYDLLAETSFLYAAYALMVEDENREYAISLFKVGTDYGMRALKVNNSKFRKEVESGTKIPDAVKFLTKDDLKGLTWYGINLAKRVTLQLADPDEVIDIQDAVAAGRRAIEMDPRYAWGASWNIIGIYYAIIPAMCGLGGGAESSREAFANGNKVENGEFGLIDVFIARYLCPLIKDTDLFDKLLNRVIEMDSCKMTGGVCLINELAKQKARFSLENKGKYFDVY